MKSTISLGQPARAYISSHLRGWLDSDSCLLSTIMGESVSHRQTLLFFNALISGIVLVFSAYTCLEAVVFLLAWFCYSVFMCEKGGLK